MLDAIKERGLQIAVKDGQPVLRGEKKEVTPELMSAIKHFRGEILSALGFKETELVPSVAVVEKMAGPVVPPGAVIVVADAQAYTDKNMKGPAYMWTWIGATTWYYVSNHPVPKQM